MIREIAEPNCKNECVTLEGMDAQDPPMEIRLNESVAPPSYYFFMSLETYFDFAVMMTGYEVWLLKRMKPRVNRLTIFNKRAYRCEKKKS